MHDRRELARTQESKQDASRRQPSLLTSRAVKHTNHDSWKKEP